MGFTSSRWDRVAVPDTRHSLINLHERFVSGDPTILDALARWVLPVLDQRLRRAFHGAAEEDMLHDALIDAFMDYVSRPWTFNSSSDDSLQRSLYQAAWRNLANLLKSDLRRRKREATFFDQLQVSTPTVTTASTVRAIDILSHILDITTNAHEREAVRQWLCGNRHAGPLVKALELTKLSPVEQRREVKRFKDRVVKRINRHLRRSGALHPPTDEVESGLGRGCTKKMMPLPVPER